MSFAVGDLNRSNSRAVADCIARQHGVVTRDQDPLRAPFRSVRPVDPPSGGPWRGMLTCIPSGRRYVFVDAAMLPEGWAGWGVAANGHVLAPHDVVRRGDGHDVMLDVCTCPFPTFLARRRERNAALSLGETVTAGVSLLRGCGELVAAHGESAFGLSGEWWLTVDGKPVFVAGPGSSTLRETTSGLLRDLSAATGRPTAWQGAISVLASPRPSESAWQRAEAGLFEIAAPLALDTAEHSAPATPPRSAPVPRLDVDTDEPSRPMWATLTRYVDADLTDLAARAIADAGRTWRALTARRRAPLVWGGVAAAAVVALGMAWPSGGESTSESAVPTHSPSDSPIAPRPAPTGEVPAVSVEPGTQDLMRTAGDLLDSVIACGADVECRARLAADPDVASKLDVVAIERERRNIVLLDDFGGVAVVRVERTDTEAPSHLVVIARDDERWLLRDVTEVAQQP